MLRRLRNWDQSRKQRKAIARVMARPVMTPGQIIEAVASPPRTVRRAHKLAVRRLYRNRHLTMDSRTRQILAENIAGPATLREMEDEVGRPVLVDALH